MSSDTRSDRLARNFDYLSTWVRNGSGEAPSQKASPACDRSAAVVCWDLAHNPAGRAHVLCQLLSPHWKVELIGPIWPRFGSTIWQPLLHERLDWHGIHVRNLLDVWREGTAVALARRFDIVIVSKPRLPGLVLGLLLAERSRCPIILDFDEDEHAFMRRGQEDFAAAAATLLEQPFEAAGTALAAQYWSVADAVTVSSWHLQRRFGGHVIRHARDGATPLVSRADARRRLGYSQSDLVLGFIGTVRPHKGLSHVLAAMDAVADARLKLMVVGPVLDPAMQRALRGRADLVLHDGCDFGTLGNYLAAADLVPLMQDPGTPIAQSQFPAKLSDAMQYGIQVVATETPPLQELAISGAIDFIAPDQLASYLRHKLAVDGQGVRSGQIRRFFDNEFSLAVNRARLDAVIAEAELNSNPFSRAVPETLQALAAPVRQARAMLAREMPSPALLRQDTKHHDIAFFWKQNDSDLFGRRPDMVVKHLLESGRVRRIVHFDHQVGPAELRRMASARVHGSHDVQAMQCPTTIARALRLADQPQLKRRIFLSDENDALATLGGHEFRTPTGYAEFVAQSLREADCDPDRTVAWVCPVVRDFHAIATRIRFRRIVVDLIDDERGWSKTPEGRQAIETEYEQTLRLADLVLTNSAGNYARFAPFRADIHVIPNGAEFDPPPANTPAPDFLAKLRHPAIGYVGNLHDRIRWDLVKAIAAERPDCDLVMIGPFEEGDMPAAIYDLPNALFPGPLAYDVARLCLRVFDCAIVPHSRNVITDAMNPLKVYNYLAAGLPVVTTPIANLEGVHDLVIVADTPDDFVAAITAALAAGRTPVERAALEHRLSWRSRIAEMLELLDAIDGQSGSPPKSRFPANAMLYG